jgi:5-methyltetrahydropteroyltriglutamate--homocysteine methyltransferase
MCGSLPRPGRRDRTRRAASGRERRSIPPPTRPVSPSATAEVVRLQQQAGISIPGDGEFGKEMGQRVNYGAWWSYSFQRMGGCQTRHGTVPDSPEAVDARSHHVDQFRRPARPGHVQRTRITIPESGVSSNRGGPGMKLPVCVDKITYTGQEAIAADIAHFKAGLAAAGIDEGFMTSIAPGSCFPHRQRILQNRGGTDITPAPMPCGRNTRRSSTPV